MSSTITLFTKLMAKSEKKEKTGGKGKKPAHKKSSGDDVNTDNGGRDAVTVPDPPKKPGQ
jgi:hypothetical protein